MPPVPVEPVSAMVPDSMPVAPRVFSSLVLTLVPSVVPLPAFSRMVLIGVYLWSV